MILFLIYALLIVLGYLLIEELMDQKTSSKTDKAPQEASDIIGELAKIVSLIAAGSDRDALLNEVMKKARVLTSSDIAYLFFKDASDNRFYMKMLDSQNPRDLTSFSLQGPGSLLAQLASGTLFLVDKDHASSDEEFGLFLKKAGISNSLAMPVQSNASLIGILGIGNNRQGFVYEENTKELLDLLSKQTALAIEHERLKSQIEKLQIRDSLTGLYNKMHIIARLQEEIKRAMVRQRPCSFVLLEVDDFQRFRNQFGVQEAEDRLRQMASLIRSLASEIDPVAKFGENEFALVLPERNKRQAHEETEEIRKVIERTFGKEQDLKRRLTVSGGISENPLDGVNAQELVISAQQLLLLAKKAGRNTILV